MWQQVALVLSILVTLSPAATTPWTYNCAPPVKPGTCLLKAVKIQDKDVIQPAATPSSDLEVRFEGSQLDYLPEALFGKFPKLETLGASRVGLKKLLAGNFAKPATLKRVDISSNYVGALPDSVFGTCVNLEVINVAENRLQLFNGVELIGCGKLRSLNVSSNRLIYFNWDPLVDLRQLEEVDLSDNLVGEMVVPKYVKKIVARNNHIHKLGTDRESFIFMLEQLDVSRNRLGNVDTLARFAKMTHIDLSYNRLLSLDFGLFRHMRGLRELNLANNNIFAVTTSELKPLTLELVDLSNNELTRLSAVDSAGISSVERLLLNNNYLVSLEVTKGATNFPRIRSVTLDGNDWACRDIESTIAELKTKKVAVPSSEAKCSPNQIIREGLCCRDLGSSFEELVLLKAEKLAEIQQSSATPSTSTIKSVTQKAATVATPQSTTTNRPTKPDLDPTTSALKQAEAQIATLTSEKATLQATLAKAQNDIKALGEKLARCKSTVNQRTGQTVLID
ncbi:leucine-rich repeats and immunoglobulin-like domains protein 2 [Culex quinquefasciatus]|uniref:leucine-rich repeats and immunoglobulin-like domains protein 2 n=1 Tax=Culex quinquefasciatus TaxID=7176 RepID=UPI0018E2DF17|nr:leucine-rich repeats and immunoglobulin-like domains protein 2 [Culex quinquefasciatus]